MSSYITEWDEDVRINVVGVGPLGAKMVKQLSRETSAFTCYEVIYNQTDEYHEQMPSLLSAIRESDLLFILTGFDDEYCEMAARALGNSARYAGVLLTIALIPDNSGITSQVLADLTESIDTVFFISEESQHGIQEPHLAGKSQRIGYSMRHMVMAITRQIIQKNYTSLDFADIGHIMRAGRRIGRLGVGMASGPDRANNAAKHALDQLIKQGESIVNATGVLTIIQGRWNVFSPIDGVLMTTQGQPILTIDDSNDISKTIHENFSEGANIKIAVARNEQLRSTDEIMVTVMAVY